MKTITLDDEQLEEVKGMLKASIIRMTEWINEAKKRKATSEVEHLELMREKRKELQKLILAQIEKENN